MCIASTDIYIKGRYEVPYNTAMCKIVVISHKAPIGCIWVLCRPPRWKQLQIKCVYDYLHTCMHKSWQITDILIIEKALIPPTGCPMLQKNQSWCLISLCLYLWLHHICTSKDAYCNTIVRLNVITLFHTDLLTYGYAQQLYYYCTSSGLQLWRG